MLESGKYMKNSNCGMEKKSFAMAYHGGEIWFEHLDAITNENDMRAKFNQDTEQIRRPSSSAYIAVNLDESNVSEEMLQYILDTLSAMEKSIRKVVFVGLDFKKKRYVQKHSKNLGFMTNCMSDFEEAKNWLLPG